VFIPRPRRCFGGNFWWAIARYLASRQPLGVHADKYAAEDWLLTNHPLSRVAVIFDADRINHNRERLVEEVYVRTLSGVG